VREGRQAPRIEEAIFGRTYFGGYSEPEVDDYLDTVAVCSGSSRRPP
jgi:DivIVA domain-containing protein